MSRLEITGLTVRFGASPILDAVHLKAGEGEVVGIIGPNGAGKSTLLKAALKLCPAEGSIKLDGRDIQSLSAKERALLMAYVPQERDTAWALSVEALVALGRLPYVSTHRGGSAKDQQAVDQAMQEMGIDHLRGRTLAELSGGESARVLIARALAQATPLLLADEPAAELDPAQQIRLLELLRKRADAGQTVLITLHELHLAARWCDRLVLIDSGRIVANGKPEEVLTPERIAQVYGCTARVERHAEGLLVIPTGLLESEFASPGS